MWGRTISPARLLISRRKVFGWPGVGARFERNPGDSFASSVQSLHSINLFTARRLAPVRIIGMIVARETRQHADFVQESGLEVRSSPNFPPSWPITVNADSPINRHWCRGRQLIGWRKRDAFRQTSAANDATREISRQQSSRRS